MLNFAIINPNLLILIENIDERPLDTKALGIANAAQLHEDERIV
jgi:hypothetical protein